jgi:hypothetical protein
MQQYLKARQQASSINKDIEEEKRKYLEYREQVLQQMDAQFKNHIAKKEEEFYQYKDQIDLERQRALRQLERQISEIRADGSKPWPQREAEVRQLEQNFYNRWYPEDEYEISEQKEKIHLFLSRMFGGLPPMMAMGRGSLGGPMFPGSMATYVITSENGEKIPPMSESGHKTKVTNIEELGDEE